MRKPLAEYFGTSSLALAVVGSGIMATNLTDDVALQLLINAAATGAILWLIITLFAPISGAHFNPLVSAIALYRREIGIKQILHYCLAQILGAISGAILANLLFDLDVFELSTKVREGSNILLSEVVATAGLIFLIFHLVAIGKEKRIAAGVASYIFAAYFFTSSTSFANPAITIGRIFSNSFTGIEATSALTFIPLQIAGAAIGYMAVQLLRVKGKR